MALLPVQLMLLLAPCAAGAYCSSCVCLRTHRAFSAKMLSSLLSHRSVLLPEIITSQVWDLAFLLVKLQEVSVSLSLPHNSVL